MNLIQYLKSDGKRAVGAIEGGKAHVVRGATSVYALALKAAADGVKLKALVKAKGLGKAIDPAAILAEGRMLAPIDHPDPAHLFVTGTGLTHLGSASTRDAMHKVDSAAAEAPLTDSMKMFRMGLENGKPAKGEVGVQPEWFYKGDGRCVVAPGQALELPAYALDGGDEVEIVGLYVIGDDGTPWRVGFALGNEYSDHVMERQNYLYLAHSKLRQCSYGPELLLGALPANVTGEARLTRNGEAIWNESWLSGDDNMAHSITNLEHHHFKYADFRRPGDVHVHFFGAATGSFTKNVKAKVGDLFEIEAQGFGRPLRNPLGAARRHYGPVSVKPL